MNWVIRSTKTVRYHTNLKEVLKPIWKGLKKYEWLLTDIDFMCDTKIPLNFDRDYFLLNHQEFEIIYQSDAQVIWGIISAIPENLEIDFNAISKLSAEDTKVWESNHYLIPQSILEIVAFDSGYTILKFKCEELSAKFKNYFGSEALSLEKFKELYMN
ncbi:hypothetical protein [Chryseobacterium wangxinyae]|uniref:hypothetical protein n=1 Tax=Chryseobacterium sp. CY353 TaxID=2997334 RepID=UPI00226E5927|nr:hypothetical protein [Chryseobacterium sp. CY353]MCY0967830.1 hypothetical protein [Chryseobacterium sp. CY353]